MRRARRRTGKNLSSYLPAPFENEEAFSKALLNCAALNSDERKTMLLEVKRAARRDDTLQLTPDQQEKIDRDIAELSK